MCLENVQEKERTVCANVSMWTNEGRRQRTKYTVFVQILSLHLNLLIKISWLNDVGREYVPLYD